MQGHIQCSKDPKHPFSAHVSIQGLLKCRRCLPRCHHPESMAAAFPEASEVGSAHRRHASAPIHHLPGWWVRSLGPDRQLPPTMGETAALPPCLWQQEKKKSAERICKIAANFGCKCYYASSQLNDPTQKDGFCLATVTIRRIYTE